MGHNATVNLGLCESRLNLTLNLNPQVRARTRDALRAGSSKNNGGTASSLSAVYKSLIKRSNEDVDPPEQSPYQT